MTVSSFNNLMFKLTKQHGSLGNYHFVMKEFIVSAETILAHHYPPMLRKCPQEELDKIVKDEEYLQRRLLTGFLTQVIYLANINGTEGYQLSISVGYNNNPNQKSNLYLKEMVHSVIDLWNWHLHSILIC